MQFQYTPYTIPLVAAVLVSAIAAGIAWYQREGKVEIYAMWIHIALTLWPLVTLLALSVTSPTAKQVLLLLFVPAIPLVIVSSLFFVLKYTGRDSWFTPTRQYLLYSFPPATLLFSITNEFHGLVLVNPQLDTSGSFAVLTYDWGVGMFAVISLCYVIWTVYVTFTFRKFLRSRNVYRIISFVALLGFLAVGIAALFSLFQVSPFPHFVLAPLVYVGVGAVVILGTTSARYARKLPIDRLLSMVGSRFDSSVPLARDFIVQEVENGIVVLDTKDRIVDINATAKKMLGLERPVGKHLMTVTRPGWVLEGGDLLELLENEEPVRELEDEVWVRTPQGKRCYSVSVSALTEDGGDNEAAAHVVLLHDITDQKEREERLEEQKAELEFQKDQLERQNERLDKFASIVSHDLRNPLNIVDGHLELLESRTSDGADEVMLAVEKLGRMQQATERMSAIIDDALTLARQGKAITDTATVDLGGAVEEAWANVDTAAATLDSQVDASIVADRDRLLNVFENLFRNAVEHGGENVTVTVGLLEGREGFYVADDGPGIPDDQKDEVLEHGYTTSTEGTGLGLSIITDIARAHGWTISVTDANSSGVSDEQGESATRQSGRSGGARFEIADVRVRPDSGAEDTAVAEQ